MGLNTGRAAAPAEVLLTGATGFLGSFLLADLLERTDLRVHALVRCGGVEEGRTRVAAALAAARPDAPLPDEYLGERLIVVPGDLARPRLGLDEARFRDLGATIEAVYHCGALVNFVYPYPALKPTNVLGTQEVIRLASTPRPKPLHHVSTLRVLGSFAGADGTPVLEDDGLDHDSLLLTGYAQSKWVAEKVVRIARERGLPACVYRPGMVTGHSRTGVSNPADFLSRMIVGCVQLGSAPVLDMGVDVTPVDFVSAAIVQLSRREASFGKAFHLVTTEPVSWNTIVEWVRAFGYPLERLPYDAWRARLLASAERSGENALAPLVHFFAQGVPPVFAGRFDCRNVRAALGEVACPRASAELLATYLSFFVRSRLLAPPPRREGFHTTSVRLTEVSHAAR